MIRVVIAEDRALVRGGFRLILDAQKDIEVVGEAQDGEDALAQARALRPDIVRMDIRLRKVDGLEATRRLLFPQRGDHQAHVTHILTELRLRDRVQAVVLSYECGLVQPAAH